MAPTVRKIVPKALTTTTALFACAVALATLSGCNFSGTPEAATVGSYTISPSQLDSDLATVAADNGYICSISGNYASPVTTVGAGTGTYDTGFADHVLGYLIDAQLAQDAASADRVTVTPLARSLATKQWRGSLGTNVSGCTESPGAVLAGLPADYRSSLYTLLAVFNSIVANEMGIGPLTTSRLAAYIASHPSQTSLDCIDYIQAATKAKANSIEAQLNAGENFAAVASKESAATTYNAGCVLPSSLTPPAAKAIAGLQPGEVSPVTAFSTAFLILEITKTEPESPAALETQLSMATSHDYSALAGKINSAASVTLDPAYGTWNGTAGNTGVPGSITPPAGPPSKYVPFPSAAVGPVAHAATSTTGAPTSPK
jgi:hypothetical protein